MAHIERLVKPDAAAFHREFVETGRPAVITGNLNWRILTRDVRTLIDADKKVVVTADERGLYGPGHYEKASLRFGDLLRKWDSDGPKQMYYYMDQQPIANLHPELLELVDYPSLLERSLLIATNLWMGEGRIRWHFDGVDNFLAQIHGRKSVRLIAPEKLPNMYVFAGQWSAIDDVDAVDLARFPRAAGIGETLDTVLEKGDLLFIPAGWWHTAMALGSWGASINFWYDTWWGSRRSLFERPFHSALDHLTHLVTQEVPEPQRLHFCRYATEVLFRIASGLALPPRAAGGWDNPNRVDFTPVAHRVPRSQLER